VGLEGKESKGKLNSKRQGRPDKRGNLEKALKKKENLKRGQVYRENKK